jgi:hypothetical protein
MEFETTMSLSNETCFDSPCGNYALYRDTLFCGLNIFSEIIVLWEFDFDNHQAQFDFDNLYNSNVWKHVVNDTRRDISIRTLLAVMFLFAHI